VNFDDLMGLLMDYFEEEHKLDPEDPFLYEPLVPPPAEPAPTVLAAGANRPKSPEEWKSLLALADFSKPKAASTPKRVRMIHPSQHLV
jgi:hypothetical protein